MFMGDTSTLHRLAQAYLNVSLRLPIDDIKVKQRLDRAYEIVNAPGYEVTAEADGVYSVAKASSSLLADTSAIYVVSNTTCTCPDYATARSNLCKHRLAIMLIEEMVC